MQNCDSRQHLHHNQCSTSSWPGCQASWCELQVAADGGGGQAIINEFKTLVREAHKAGIEVILDVVFNHTAEGNEQGPTISFRW
jgi:hypothetical protein